MSDDEMRAEFEQWAKNYYGYASDDLAIHGKFYIYSTVEECWQIWQAAYQAGRKAEREEVESESFETARRCSVCGDWFSSSSQTLHPCPHCKTKPEGDDERG